MEILSVAAQKRINVYSVKGAWRLDQSIQSKIIAMGLFDGGSTFGQKMIQWMDRR
jgi:hypothetical protein